MFYDGSRILKNVVNPTRTTVQPFTTKTIRIPESIGDGKVISDILKSFFDDEEYDCCNCIENKKVIYTDDYYLSMDGNLLYNVYTDEEDGKVKLLVEFKVPQSISTIEELKERLSLKLKNKNELLIKIQKDKDEEEKETKYKKKVKSFETKIDEDLKMDVVQFKKKTKTDYEKTQDIHNVKFVGFEKGVMKVEFEIGSSGEIIDIEI